MILIPSSNYLNSEFILEFGMLPACAIPIMGFPLIKKQVESLIEKFPGEKIILTLPAGYRLSNNIKYITDKHDVDIIYASSSLHLLDVIRLAYSKYKESGKERCIRILLGDTLIEDIPDDNDVFCIAVPEFKYTYHAYKGKSVYCGYYSMSNIECFEKLIVECDTFESLVTKYSHINGSQHVEVENWYDFGHPQMYYSARRQFLASRVFNSMSVIENAVIKFGPEEKLKSESLWFALLPDNLKQYSAKYLGCGDTSNGFYYKTKFYSKPALSDIYVYGQLDEESWTKIFNEIKMFLKHSHENYKNLKYHDLKSARKTWSTANMKKIKSRLSNFPNIAPYNLDEIQVNEKVINNARLQKVLIGTDFKKSFTAAYSHGDLCFSNVIYDLSNNSIFLIDPKGVSAPDEVGNLAYDVAKIAHSCLYHYDDILAGNYQFEELTSGQYKLNFMGRKIDDYMRSWVATTCKEFGIDFLLLKKMVGSLFLSMIPLHSDSAHRQKILFLNGLLILSECYDD